MHPDTFQSTVSKLRDLADHHPDEAMNELESLVRSTSVRTLAEILQAVYGEISRETGIDWHFTALQWKLGNTGREQFRDLSQQPRFMIWTFPFQAEAATGSETRYTTCLPFCFKPEWIIRSAKVTSAETSG